MKRVIAGTLIMLIAAGGFFYWKQKKKAERRRADLTSIATVAEGAIEQTVEASGEVKPLNRVEIKPPIAGRIEVLLADEGDAVKSGQILAWMSSSDRAAILDAARAKGPEELAKWTEAYKPTPIVAPLSGVLILRNVVVGQTVDASTILFAMSDRLIVYASVDEADIGSVKLRMPVRITLDAYPDQSINGKVSQILFEGKNVSNVITYGVKIAPDTVPPFFRSQMTANVVFIMDRRENTLLIPSQAVRSSPEGKQVSIPVPDGKPEKRTVETGLESGGQTEILSGLAAGDQVIVSRQRYVPQRGADSSPLALGSRRSSNQSQNTQNTEGRQRSR